MSMLGQIMQQQVFVQSGWYQRQSGILLPLEVRQILEKYQATMLLPGVSGELRFSYQPGNYLESTGQTLAAADQQVGLVVDAARSPGEELLPAWSAGFSSLTNIGIGASAGTVNLVGAEIVMVSGDGSADRAEFTIGGLVAGRLYQARVTARRGSQGAGQNFSSWTVGTINRVSIDSTDNKEYVINFVASGTGGMIRAYAADISGGAIGGAVIVSSISVRELPGIHASQSTSGYQPVLRNTAGIQSWQFDGTDDRLSLSAVPFQTQDVSFAITAFNPSVIDGTLRRFWEVAGNGSESTAGVVNGNVQWICRGDSGSQASLFGTGVGATGVMRVATCVNTGAGRILRVDGAQQGALNTTVVANSTANVATIGNRASGDRAFSGFKHLQIFGKGSTPPTEAELLTLERWAASIQGRTL